MFQALQPMLHERSLHLLLSASKDGKIGVYVSPVKKDNKEDDAFVTPFRCEGTAEELDTQLAGILTQWITARTTVTTSLADALAQAEKEAKEAAELAKKKAALKKPTTTSTAKQPTPSKVVPAKTDPVMPSLLDAPATQTEVGADDTDDAPEPAAADAVQQGTVESPAAECVVTETPAVPAPPAATATAPVAPSTAILTADPVTADLF